MNKSTLQTSAAQLQWATPHVAALTSRRFVSWKFGGNRVTEPTNSGKKKKKLCLARGQTVHTIQKSPTCEYVASTYLPMFVQIPPSWVKDGLLIPKKGYPPGEFPTKDPFKGLLRMTFSSPKNVPHPLWFSEGPPAPDAKPQTPKGRGNLLVAFLATEGRSIWQSQEWV